VDVSDVKRDEAKTGKDDSDQENIKNGQRSRAGERIAEWVIENKFIEKYEKSERAGNDGNEYSEITGEFQREKAE